MDDFERAWRKQLAAEKKYIDERSRRSDSRLNRFLQTKVPEKLKDTLDTGFAKAFELIFAKGTGVIEKTYNRRDIERSSRVRRIIAENNPSGRALNEASRGSVLAKAEKHGRIGCFRDRNGANRRRYTGYPGFHGNAAQEPV